MNQIEKKIYSFLIWLTVPISCFLGFWWTCYFFTNNEKIISTMMLVGIITGIAIVVVLHIKYGLQLLLCSILNIKSIPTKSLNGG